MADATFNGKRVKLVDLPENVTTIDGEWKRQVTQGTFRAAPGASLQADYTKIGLSEQEEGLSMSRIRIGEIAGKEVAQQESDPNSTINKIIKKCIIIHESDEGEPNEANFVQARHGISQSPFRVIFKAELKAHREKARALKKEEEEAGNMEAAKLRFRIILSQEAVNNATGIGPKFFAGKDLQELEEQLHTMTGGKEGKPPHGDRLTSEQEDLAGLLRGNTAIRRTAEQLAEKEAAAAAAALGGG